MFRIFLNSIFLLLLFTVQVFAAPITRDAKVAVMDFGTRPGATDAEINVNNAEYVASTYIIDRLVENKCFIVQEKDFVMDSLKADNLQVTGLIPPETAKKIGDKLNVKYIIYGNITNVSLSDTGVQILNGGVTKCTVKAHMIGRVMDIDTGSIIMAVKGDGKSASSYTKIPGVLAGTISFGTVKVTQDSVHNAIQKAAFAMVDVINKKVHS